MTSRTPPQRQNSSVSTTSSGGKTVTGRRRSSASNHHPPSSSSLFARLTGKRDADDTDSSSRSESPSQTPTDGSAERDNRDMASFGARDGDADVGDGDDVEAGPSDYWRRPPTPPTPQSPPAQWRERSDERWPDDLEDGGMDVWRPHQSPAGGRVTPPFVVRSPTGAQRTINREVDEEGQDCFRNRQNTMGTPGEEPGHPHDGPAGDGENEHEADEDDLDDAQVDVKEYERRMKDVLDTNTPSTVLSPAASTASPGLGGYDSRRQLGRGGYDAEYQDILGEKAGGMNEEDVGPLEFPQRDDASDATPSSMTGSIKPVVSPSPLKRNVTPYLHPSVSRLRSHLRSTSTTTVNSTTSAPRPSHARIPSHFSQISLTRSESTSTISILPSAPAQTAAPDASPAFAFHPLRQLSAHLFGRKGSGRSSPIRPPAGRKASGLAVDDVDLGRPMVLDVRGLIAVGTSSGYVVVYGFGQDLKHVLGTEIIAQASGAVTAVTISPDQTYIAVGHATGNIYLYDLASPAKPARTTLALTLKQVLSGRKEGHLQGSRILHIGFVGARHTSIVSGDEHGRAFWWSLGRVMGVESNDVVRMLGSYPEHQVVPAPDGISRYPSKKPTTLFGVHSLPLGDKPHATDFFNLSVMLTPVKLVVVGMKPTAKTWFRRMRDSLGGPFGGVMGCAVWLRAGELEEGSDPVLAYAWGTHVRFLRIRAVPSELGDAKKNEDVPEFVEGRKFDAPNGVLALQWYDANHLLIVTTAEIILLDVRSGRTVENTPLQTKLLTANDFYAGLAARVGPSLTVPDATASSIRTHRGKLFLLTQSNVQVGTLQHWNDRILARVHAGDFLSAIQVALGYYEGKASGNYIGLPEDPTERKGIVGRRIRELMRASLEWAFSEDRMHDDTHYSSDGRGVDLTSLFEGLAGCCIDACLAMDDLSFLFDDTYESYANAGIHGIFLSLLEGYIFDGRIKDVPPHIIQALIRMHDDMGELDLAEAIIWHVDPISLDINQAVTICEEHRLWDALIHVYTRSMRDWTAPIVKLIRVIFDIQQQRQIRPGLVEGDEAQEEHLAQDAYKLFAYIEQILSGVSYPSNEPLPISEADHARAEVYSFLFSGRVAFWPPGPGGEPVLPDYDHAGADGQPTPYPYLDLLLHFDAEAFLHSMDIAFEDGYLNDHRASFSRQTIINIMLDLMSPPLAGRGLEHSRFHSGDVTLLHIFVARNLPKYPQFLFIPPSTLQNILVSLASDTDQSTREDRQLAAEYLLSAYTPHDSDEMLSLFKAAGFWRILRAWYDRERRWAELVRAYVDDSEVSVEVFAELHALVRSVKRESARAGRGNSVEDVKAGVQRVIPGLLDVSVRQTALLLDADLPDLHSVALAALAALDGAGSEHKRMAYLRCLLQPTDDEGPLPMRGVSANVSADAKHAYVDLLVSHESSSVISFLDEVGSGFFDLNRLGADFERRGVYDGQLWALDRQGKTQEAFDSATDVVRAQAADLVGDVVSGDEGGVHVALERLGQVTRMAVRLCKEHSNAHTPGVEDWWFGVLHELLEVNSGLGALNNGNGIDGQDGIGAGAPGLRQNVEEQVRGLVTDTLGALVSVSSSRLSFPRLFKRLVDGAEADGPAGDKKNPKEKRRRNRARPRAYAQFRSILTSMLESYRMESEVLVMTTRLVQDDLFGNVKDLAERRERGWRPVQGVCDACGEELFGEAGTRAAGQEADADGEAEVKTPRGVVLLGDGRGLHARCR